MVKYSQIMLNYTFKGCDINTKIFQVTAGWTGCDVIFKGKT
jgi:hypothetical protein